MKKWLLVLGVVIVLAAIGNMMNGTVPGGGPATLTDAQQASIADVHKSHAWFPPKTIEVRNGIVVIDYEVPDNLAIPKQKFAEERLLAIREALLPDGFDAYRVNVNGPSPGTGLIQRYGSARFLGSKVEWLKP